MDEDVLDDVVSAAYSAGMGRGEHVCVALVDSSGHLLRFTRSPRAVVPSIDLAIGKAYTAATLGVETPVLKELTAPGGPLEGLLAAATKPRALVPLPGGAPLRIGDVILGLGVGGSASPQTDHELALAAIASAAERSGAS